MGGSETQIVQPQAPAQPSTAEAVDAWVKSMPQVYETQMQYAPLLAAQQVGLAQQFAAPLGQAYQQAQAAMYPETAALQEQLAGQAGEGMETGLEDWEKDLYRSEMAAQLGTNVGSPIGADYMSRGLLQAEQQRRDYYRNLGLSVAGRQPLAQPSTPMTPDYMGGYTPQSVMGFQASTYGPYAAASRPFMVPGEPSPFGQIAGSIGGGLATSIPLALAHV